MFSTIEFLLFRNQLLPLFDVETKTKRDESQERSHFSLCLALKFTVQKDIKKYLSIQTQGSLDPIS